LEFSSCNHLYVDPVDSENKEEYLEAVWMIEATGESPVKISTISQKLKIAPPSAVQMLKKLEKEGYLKYKTREGVILTRKGNRIGRRMVRNGMLIESLMVESLGIEIDPKVACGIEHHMTDEFTNAICSLMRHPIKCPHGNLIPKGTCCNRNE